MKDESCLLLWAASRVQSECLLNWLWDVREVAANELSSFSSSQHPFVWVYVSASRSGRAAGKFIPEVGLIGANVHCGPAETVEDWELLKFVCVKSRKAVIWGASQMQLHLNYWGCGHKVQPVGHWVESSWQLYAICLWWYTINCDKSAKIGFFFSAKAEIHFKFLHSDVAAAGWWPVWVYSFNSTQQNIQCKHWCDLDISAPAFPPSLISWLKCS